MPSQTVYWPVPGLLINMSGRRIVQLKPLFISTAPQGLIGDDVFQDHLNNEAYPERANTFLVFKKARVKASALLVCTPLVTFLPPVPCVRRRGR